MNTKSSSVVKYVGSAMAVGGTVMLGTALAGSNASLKKKAKKTANKAIEAVDAVLTTMQNMVK